MIALLAEVNDVGRGANERVISWRNVRNAVPATAAAATAKFE